MNQQIKVEATINSPIEKVWTYYTEPNHIVNWNAASPDWHSPKAENDLRVGGRFKSRMESKDGSEGFDFEGTYSEVNLNNNIKYTMDDGRKVEVKFESINDNTQVTISFDPENENSLELQKFGWQSILDNFKKYTEEN